MRHNSASSLSVIIATRGRRSNLTQTVSCIQKQQLTGLLPEQCEIVLVYNGEGSKRVHGTIENKPIPLHESWISEAGKSKALNLAVSKARGELLVFTDDDVIPSPMWLSELWRASQAYPSEIGFAGPIRPEYPAQTPDWLLRHPLAEFIFGHFEPRAEKGEEPLPLICTPFGANFAVRAAAAKTLRFREDLGPSDVNGSLLGEETAYLKELRTRYSIFCNQGGFIYVPTASVTHMVQSHQVEVPSIMERFFCIGRTQIAAYGTFAHLSRRPRLLCAEHNMTREQTLIAGAEINFYCGQLYQARLLGKVDAAEYLLFVLERLRVSEHLHLLSPSAMEMPLFNDFKSAVM